MNKRKNFLLDKDFIKWQLFKTEELNAWWKEFREKNPQYSNELNKAIEDFNSVKLNYIKISENNKEEIYSDLMNKISKYNQQKRRKIFFQIFSSAAAILLIAVLSVFYFNNQNKDLSTTYNDEHTIIGLTLPEEDIVIISGDQKMNIANNASLELADGSKVVVTDSTDNKLEMKLSPVKMNKLMVPYGKRSNLTLADGSKVWINAGSQIDFPTEFRDGDRKIYVNGEVFIDVEHDDLKPFIVQTSEMEIRVFGTSFNISAYEDDDTNSVVLVDGKVSVKSNGAEAELFPNEKAELINGSFTKETVDVSEYISWTKDIFEFNETPVSEILKKVGRYYNVDFENDNEVSLNDKTCSGKLFLSENLDSVMVSISHITSTNYMRKDNLIKISKK